MYQNAKHDIFKDFIEMTKALALIKYTYVPIYFIYLKVCIFIL